VRMVTGDSKVTALAIARECGIVSEDYIDEFDQIMNGTVSMMT
jgi:magnesium-transporting ATPase (P-type)